MKNKIFLSLFILLFTTLALADHKIFCTEMKKEMKEKHLSFGTILGDILSLTYLPTRYGAPVSVKARVENKGNGSAQVQNMILSLDSLLPEEERKIELSKALEKQIKKEYRNIRKALAQNDTEACSKYLEKKQFDPLRLNSLIEQQNRLFDAKISQDAKYLKRIIPEHFLKLDWELKKGTHLEDIHELINSEKAVNIIFIAHATSLGQLLDSRGNILPKNLFSELRGNVQSLSLFSCHASKVKEFYGLDQVKVPDLFIAKDSEFMGQSEVAPLQAASFFIRSIDKHLSKVSLAQWEGPSSKLCELNLNGINPLLSDYGVFVNNHFAGTLKMEESEKSFYLPCESIQSVGLRPLSILTLKGNLKLDLARISYEGENLKLIPVLNQAQEVIVLKAKP